MQHFLSNSKHVFLKLLGLLLILSGTLHPAVQAQEATPAKQEIVPLKVGDKVPDMPFHDAEGRTSHLYDYTGKMLIIDLWASWCGPCIASFPEMKEIKETYPDVEIIGVNVMDKEEDWLQASEKHTFNWPNLHDRAPKEKGILTQFGIKGLPSYIFLDPDGKVLRVLTGYMPGSLKLLVPYEKEYARPPKTTIFPNGHKVAEYPRCERPEAFTVVQRAELADTATILRLKLFYPPGQHFQISPALCLRAEGKEYKIRSTEGFRLGEDSTCPGYEGLEFSCTFEPLPLDTEKFDLYESNEGYKQNLYGILIGK